MRLLLVDPASFTPQYDHELASSLVAGGRRGGAADLALPIRRLAGGERVHALGDLLPRREPPLRALPRADSAEGGGAWNRADPHPLAAGTDRPPSVAGGAGDRQPRPAHAAPLRLHRARPLPSPHGAEARPVEAACSGASPASSCTASMVARRCASSASTLAGCASSRTPSSQATRRGGRRRDGALAGRDPFVQGPRRHDRRRRQAAGCAAPRRRRSDGAGRAVPAAAGAQAEWRLGYATEDEIDRALGEATLAVFPYQPEIDQSGALLRALGAGVPVVAYDVCGIAEPVRRFEAGRVVPAGDVDALTDAIRELLSDGQALERARRARGALATTLTWDDAAAAHVELYGELV